MPINNIVVISDTHSGCRLGLCPPEVKIDDNVTIQASPLQQKVWSMWNEFIHVWVPQVTKGEPFVVVHNGDALEGVHHHATTQITQNMTDQKRIASVALKVLLDAPMCAGYYHIRGTEAHVGNSGEHEEDLAKSLNATPSEEGNYARWELWLRLPRGPLVHFTHHIGTTSSAAYEGTAPHKELVEAYNESGRWGDEPPDVVVRSHRHRHYEIRLATQKGMAISTITPGWQLKTPHVWKGTLGRTGTPQIGGILIRSGDEDPVYTRAKIWKIERAKEVIL
jgi:hypothetical protein